MKTFNDIWSSKRAAFEEGLHSVDTLDLIGEWAWKECKSEYESKIKLAIKQLELLQDLLKKEGLDSSVILDMLRQ